jgi:hypothetical protein
MMWSFIALLARPRIMRSVGMKFQDAVYSAVEVLLEHRRVSKSENHITVSI